MIEIRGLDYVKVMEPQEPRCDSLLENAEATGSYVGPPDYDQLLALLGAKDALIASLKAEISKQNKAEDELLATGEKLAEEK